MRSGFDQANQRRRSMYSVLRFSGFSSTEHLHSSGAEVNLLVSGLFTGPDRVQDRFSCSISEDDDWDSHCRSIENTLSNLSPVIRKCTSSGVNMQLDIAIDPEDYSGRLLTIFPLKESLLQSVLDANVKFVLSLYGTTN